MLHPGTGLLAAFSFNKSTWLSTSVSTSSVGAHTCAAANPISPVPAPCHDNLHQETHKTEGCIIRCGSTFKLNTCTYIPKLPAWKQLCSQVSPISTSSRIRQPFICFWKGAGREASWLIKSIPAAHSPPPTPTPQSSVRFNRIGFGHPSTSNSTHSTRRSSGLRSRSSGRLRAASRSASFMFVPKYTI